MQWNHSRFALLPNCLPWAPRVMNSTLVSDTDLTRACVFARSTIARHQSAWAFRVPITSGSHVFNSFNVQTASIEPPLACHPLPVVDAYSCLSPITFDLNNQRYVESSSCTAVSLAHMYNIQSFLAIPKWWYIGREKKGQTEDRTPGLPRRVIETWRGGC